MTFDIKKFPIDLKKRLKKSGYQDVTKNLIIEPFNGKRCVKIDYQWELYSHNFHSSGDEAVISNAVKEGIGKIYAEVLNDFMIWIFSDDAKTYLKEYEARTEGGKWVIRPGKLRMGEPDKDEDPDSVYIYDIHIEPIDFDI